MQAPNTNAYGVPMKTDPKSSARSGRPSHRHVVRHDERPCGTRADHLAAIGVLVSASLERTWKGFDETKVAGILDREAAKVLGITASAFSELTNGKGKPGAINALLANPGAVGDLDLTELVTLCIPLWVPLALGKNRDDILLALMNAANDYPNFSNCEETS